MFILYDEKPFLCMFVCVCTYMHTHGSVRIRPRKWSNNVTPSPEIKKKIERTTRTKEIKMRIAYK